jgi:hypothetical protein
MPGSIICDYIMNCCSAGKQNDYLFSTPTKNFLIFKYQMLSVCAQKVISEWGSPDNYTVKCVYKDGDEKSWKYYPPVILFSQDSPYLLNHLVYIQDYIRDDTWHKQLVCQILMDLEIRPIQLWSLLYYQFHLRRLNLQTNSNRIQQYIVLYQFGQVLELSKLRFHKCSSFLGLLAFYSHDYYTKTYF